MPQYEEITPKPEEKKTIKNEYDFRRELLSALEEDFSSNNEVKDTEIYRQHILHALGQEFDQDDIKQTNNFRAKVVDGVKELVNGGGGGGGGDAYIPARVAIDTKGNNIKLNCVEVANYQEENEYFNSVVDRNLNTMYVNNIIVPLSANAEQPGANLYLTLTTGLSTAVTGDIEDYGNGDLYVTGDGTITITH